MKRLVDAARAFFGPFLFAWRQRRQPVPSYVVKSAEAAGISPWELLRVEVKRTRISIDLASTVDAGRFDALARELALRTTRPVCIERTGGAA